jgi:predicted nucleic acid-binding Zn ribbon protein
MSAPVKKKCPECGTLKLKRLIGSGSAVVFKGSGFYETDYRSESYKKDAKAEKESLTPKKDDKKSKDKSSTPKKD